MYPNHLSTRVPTPDASSLYTPVMIPTSTLLNLSIRVSPATFITHLISNTFNCLLSAVLTSYGSAPSTAIGKTIQAYKLLKATILGVLYLYFIIIYNSLPHLRFHDSSLSPTRAQVNGTFNRFQPFSL